MEYVRLGRSGLRVSELCLGTWMFGTQTAEGREVVDRDGAQTLLDAAWERGINFFDTANNYGDGRSESYLGEWLGGQERENFVIASKMFWITRGLGREGLSRKNVMAEVQDTLERLDSDYLDIYYIHGWLDEANLEETLSAMNDLVRAGMVHYIGISNFTSWQLMKAQWLSERHGWEPVTVIQPRFNAADNVPFTVDPAEMPLPDLYQACRDQGVAVCPYAPVAGGFLSGKYQRTEGGEAVVPDDSRGSLTKRYGPFPDRWWRVLDEVKAVARELGATPAQVAVRWSMMIDGVTSVPIVGGRKVEQLEENLGALEIELSKEQHERIREAGVLKDPVSPYIYT